MSQEPNYTLGGLYIFSEPSDADIYLNWNPVRDSAENIAKTPTILTDIPQGLYNITLKLPGHHDDSITVEVVGGYYSSAYGVLLPFPVPVPPT